MSCPCLLSGVGSRAPLAAPSSSATCAPPACIRFRALRKNVKAPAGVRLCCTSGRQRVQVVCMAHPRRVARVSSQIQREIGDMFVADPVIQAAICPERKGGGDTLSAVASITNTYVSNDLQVVKVFVSVYSDDYGKRVAMQNLTRLEPYVRRVIGQRVRLRRTPEVRFVYDDSEEEADLVYRVLGRAEVERYRAELEAEMAPGAAAAASGPADGSAPNGQEGEDGGGDDEDYDDEEEEEDGDGDWDALDPDELPQAYPNPFGDLFEDDVTVSPVGGRQRTGRDAPARPGSRGRAGRRGRGRGGSGRGQQRRPEEPEDGPDVVEKEAQ